MPSGTVYADYRRDGLQQALEYAEMLQLPFIFASNGDGFVFHDRTLKNGEIERTQEFISEASQPLWTRIDADAHMR